MSRTLRFILAVALSSIVGGGTALALEVVTLPEGDYQQEASLTSKAASPDQGIIATEESNLSKLKSGLDTLYDEYLAYKSTMAEGQGSADGFESQLTIIALDGDRVRIEAVARSNAPEDVEALASELETLGAEVTGMGGSVVGAKLPVNSLGLLSDLESLNFAQPAVFETQAGSVVTEGDQAQRSDQARTLGVTGLTGAGVLVGVISDSYGCLPCVEDPNNPCAAEDVASDELPADVLVVQETDCADESLSRTDEGRAMMQLVHDVAPGASLAFHTAAGGIPAFADAIRALRDEGAAVIVDDIKIPFAPMFQDGPAAQAVDEVTADGVAYFSSAGNNSRNAYEGPFRASSTLGPQGGLLHDFDPGAGVDTRLAVTFPSGETSIFFHWSNPYASAGGLGAVTDMQMCLWKQGNPGPTYCSPDNNIGADPSEGVVINLPAVTTIDILLSHKEGPAPDYVKLVMVNPRTNTDGDLIVFEDPYEGTGAGPLHGHANAAGATAVGAAWWFNTPEFGVAPPLLEFFSSAGNTNIYYNVEGNPITPPEERSKPEITAPDRGATSLFPHFIGTSGAAPHAAAVAALMLEANPTLAPAEIKAALQSSAVDILERVAFDEVTKTATGSGTDADSGAGLIDAYAAVEAVTTPPTGGPGPKLHVGTVTDVGSSGWKTVNLPVSYTSMVVVASINYANSSVPAIVRIRDAVGSSFDVRVDNPSGTPVTGVTVHYLVAEEGAYTEADDGITMEAVKFTSTVTDRKNGWTGEDRGYANSYTTPVVLGQVMSYNDPGWSVFWAQGSSRTSPPSASALKVGKHVGEDTDVTRADEQIGYIVFESGNGSLGEIDYATAVGADSVKGITNSPPFSYSGTFPATPTAALVSTAGMDGGDGGWPILYGTSPITSSTLNLAFDEDQVGDTERNHTSEQAAYIVFGAQGENQAPTASFTSSASGLTVNFTDTSEDSDGSIVSWAWSFGDESTSTDQNPSHTYASTGTYTVTLTVTDDDGDSDSSSQPVSVTAPEEPIVVFYDGFENGAWDGLWTEDSQDDWFTSTQRSTSGSYSAEVDGSANNAELVSIPINLQGRTSATIGFDWYIEKGLDSGEYLAFDVSTDDGATWVEKAKLAGNVDQENTWHQIQIELNGIAALQMRFRGKMSRGNEDADVDEVSVTAQ